MLERCVKRALGRLFFLGLVLFSCSRQDPRSPNSLVAGIEKMPQSRHPVFATDAYSQWITGFIYEGLVRVGPQLTIVPELALKIEQPQPTLYRFELPKGVRFHTGQELQCSDVLASLNAYRSEVSPFAAAFSVVRRAECKPGNWFEVELSKPQTSFLTDFVLVKIFPANEKPDRQIPNPVGTGPFTFSRWEEQSVALSAYPQFRKGPTWFNELVFREIQDPQTRLLSLKRGTIDILLNSLEPHQIEEARLDPKLGIVESAGVSFHYLGFNFRHPNLSKRRVREAMFHGIDRDTIIQSKLKGFAVAADSLLSQTHALYTGSSQAATYDPQKAQQLMREEGFSAERPLKVELKTSTDSFAVSLAFIYKEQLKSAFFDIDIKSIEWATFYNDIKTGNYQIHALRRVGLMDPAAFFDYFHSSQFPPSGNNRGFYKNPRMDQISEAIRTQTNSKLYQKSVQEAQKLFREELPYIPLWHMKNVAVFRKEHLSNLELLPNGHLESLLSAVKAVR